MGPLGIAWACFKVRDSCVDSTLHHVSRLTGIIGCEVPCGTSMPMSLVIGISSLSGEMIGECVVSQLLDIFIGEGVYFCGVLWSGLVCCSFSKVVL